MNLTTDDLIILHLNVKKQVGKEIFARGLRAYGDTYVLKSIQKLIENNKLIIKKEIETSLNYFTVSQLKKILKNHNLPISGTKPKLIQRIKEHYNSIQDMELPSYYEATDEGLLLIEDTKYLLHFHNSLDDISYKQAFYIDQNYIDNSCEDKILAIYDYKLNKKEDIDSVISIYIALCDYYLKKKDDLDNSRKYLNIIYGYKLKRLINSLGSDIQESWHYDESDKSLKYDAIDAEINSIINHIFVNTYEILIVDLNYSNDKLLSLFKKDVSDYNFDLSNELIYYFVNCIVAFVVEDNETEALSKLYEWLKIKYPYKYTDESYISDDDEIGYDDYDENYDDDMISIDIQELMKIKEDINIYIDKYDGQIIPYLKEERLNTFLNENNHEY